jgi:Asp-tRNA(Asn)/Glu-tRNA(Gln) amidotransferase A subunit family amidase
MTSQTQAGALTASELTDQYRARHLSPVDVVQASLSRI